MYSSKSNKLKKYINYNLKKKKTLNTKHLKLI